MTEKQAEELMKLILDYGRAKEWKGFYKEGSHKQCEAQFEATNLLVEIGEFVGHLKEVK